MRICHGVPDRVPVCGKPLPRRAKKFCRTCRRIARAKSLSRYQAAYYRDNRDRILAQRDDLARRRRGEKTKAEAEAEAAPREAVAEERTRFLPAFELDLLG